MNKPRSSVKLSLLLALAACFELAGCQSIDLEVDSSAQASEFDDLLTGSFRDIYERIRNLPTDHPFFWEPMERGGAPGDQFRSIDTFEWLGDPPTDGSLNGAQRVRFCGTLENYSIVCRDGWGKRINLTNPAYLGTTRWRNEVAINNALQHSTDGRFRNVFVGSLPETGGGARVLFSDHVDGVMLRELTSTNSGFEAPHPSIPNGDELRRQVVEHFNDQSVESILKLEERLNRAGIIMDDGQLLFDRNGTAFAHDTEMWRVAQSGEDVAVKNRQVVSRLVASAVYSKYELDPLGAKLFYAETLDKYPTLADDVIGELGRSKGYGPDKLTPNYDQLADELHRDSREVYRRPGSRIARDIALTAAVWRGALWLGSRAAGAAGWVMLYYDVGGLRERYEEWRAERNPEYAIWRWARELYADEMNDWESCRRCYPRPRFVDYLLKSLGNHRLGLEPSILRAMKRYEDAAWPLNAHSHFMLQWVDANEDWHRDLFRATAKKIEDLAGMGREPDQTRIKDKYVRPEFNLAQKSPFVGVALGKRLFDPYVPEEGEMVLLDEGTWIVFRDGRPVHSPGPGFVQEVGGSFGEPSNGGGLPGLGGGPDTHHGDDLLTCMATFASPCTLGDKFVEGRVIELPSEGSLLATTPVTVGDFAGVLRLVLDALDYPSESFEKDAQTPDDAYPGAFVPGLVLTNDGSCRLSSDISKDIGGVDGGEIPYHLRPTTVCVYGMEFNPKGCIVGKPQNSGANLSRQCANDLHNASKSSRYYLKNNLVDDSGDWRFSEKGGYWWADIRPYIGRSQTLHFRFEDSRGRVDPETGKKYYRAIKRKLHIGPPRVVANDTEGDCDSNPGDVSAAVTTHYCASNLPEQPAQALAHLEVVDYGSSNSCPSASTGNWVRLDQNGWNWDSESRTWRGSLPVGTLGPNLQILLCVRNTLTGEIEGVEHTTSN